MKSLPALFLLLFLTTAFSDEKKKESLSFEKWTPGFEVPDPVAISFDPQGRAYVTQTQRRKAQDLDIRQNLDWKVQDISSQSIEDKENFYRKIFTKENSEANKKRVEDFNGDGVHDIEDLKTLSERIHIVEDTDGDGFADRISLFTEGMDEILTGVAGGVLYHQGEVFACPVPELIKFRDTDGDDKADQKDSLARGFGVKVAYAGHDMHGLTVGPDGRIYWTVGDKALSVTSKEGLKFHYPYEGALMRCEPDGSLFEVYAHGLRNIQEIAFDKYGNFFGVDNDSDGKGERERFVHVEQYSDAGWRSNWQYRQEKYNPWMDEDMHVPYYGGQPAWFTPPRGNYENGPAGFKYNPGTALSAAYTDHFFLTSAPRGQQWAFQIEEDGDSYKMVNDRQVGSGIALIGLNFGPDGGLYGVDWGATDYPLNEKGGIWRIDVPDSEKNPLRKETKRLIALDFSKLDNKTVAEYLSNPDQRIRLKAQFELVDRKAKEVLMVHSMSDTDLMAQIHSIWGLGQLARQGVYDPLDWNFIAMLSNEDLAFQALRAFTDQYGQRLALHQVPPPPNEPESIFSSSIWPSLEIASIKLQTQILLALARIGDVKSTPHIVNFLNQPEHQLKSTHLRHAGVMALAGCVTTDQLRPLDTDTRFFQVCKVVALRKRQDPAVSEYLTSEDPVVAAEAAQAIYGDWMIPDAMPALAAALGNHADNEMFTRRAIAANLWGGSVEDGKRVVDFLKTNPTQSKPALETLESWSDPDVLDPIEGRYRPVEPRDPAILSEALSSGLSDLLISENSNIASRVMSLATKLKIALSDEALLAIAKNEHATPDLKISALKGLQSQGNGAAFELAENYLHSPSADLQIAALEVLAELDKPRTFSEVETLLQNSQTAVPVKQFAIRLLPGIGGEDFLKNQWDSVLAGKVESGIALDIIEAAQNVPSLSDAVTKYEMDQMAKLVTEPLAPFLYTKTGGDVDRGRQVFEHHAAAECVRCHKIDKGPGSNVGPILAGMGKKKGTDYILESLVAPQAQVTQGYGTIALTLNDGSIVTGQFREEKKNEIIIRTPEDKTIKVKISDIKERSPVVSLMPPMGFILKKSELRDLIAYLMSI